MRHRISVRREANFAALLAVGVFISGCATLEGGPQRLYTVDQEVSEAQRVLPQWETSYYTATVESDRKRWRDEIIARRMYIVDVEFSRYEAGLTRDRQQVGFGLGTATQGLTTAGALVASAGTARVLTGLAGATNAVRGIYDQEIIIAKTIQIVQAQMRSLRDDKARVIQAKTVLPTDAYTLSMALHDLEDYYRAGTMTAGLLKAVGEAGADAQISAQLKDASFTGTFGPDTTSETLQKFITAGGKPNLANIRLLNGLLNELGQRLDVRTIVDSTEALPIRQQLITYAARRGIDLTR